MDRDIDRAGKQRLLNFLGEQPFRSHLRERHVGDFVAGGFDDFDSARLAQFLQAALNPVRLPEGQLGTARADGQHVGPTMLIQAENLSDGGDDVVPVGLRGLAADFRDGSVGDLVHHAFGERFDGLFLLRSQRSRTWIAMRAISVARSRSSSSCSLMMVGATSRAFRRATMRSTSS